MTNEMINQIQIKNNQRDILFVKERSDYKPALALGKNKMFYLINHIIQYYTF